MTIDEALVYGRALLTASPTPHLDARLLLQYALHCSHSYLIAYQETPLSDEQELLYRQLLQRATRREPIPYILGRVPFFDFELDINPAVLIPRPETEQLVETVIAWVKNHQVTRLADIGTGSGAIAIALARQLPAAVIEAVDLSPEALTIAMHNANRLAHGRIRHYQGDLLEPLTAGLEGIVANLPYVTDSEWTALDDAVKSYEPALALKGGPDGLALIRRLLAQAVPKLAPGGAIFLEIGWQQGTAVTQLAQTFFPESQIAVQRDFAGHDRIVVVMR
jgi:release factor glutamine methyltransferase